MGILVVFKWNRARSVKLGSNRATTGPNILHKILAKFLLTSAYVG